MRVGYASGYWGDDPTAPLRLLDQTELDYLGMDYLAEITMAILKRQQENDETLGYARDFPPLVGRLAGKLIEKDVTLVANAGGVNPISCTEAVIESVDDEDFTVAAVTGDDVLHRLDTFQSERIDLSHLDTDASFEHVADDIVAANAYLGAFPVAEALESDVDVVITGRCVDAALVLGPLIHEFGWAEGDHDRLASGVIAGHLLECGTQVTGGVFMEDWQSVEFTNMGYPIAEVDSNGEFTVTKPANTGGVVTEETVKEQLVYEISDPGAYLTPDVSADFTSASLTTVGEDQVRVTGVKGETPPEELKVTALYEDGYKTQLLLIYSWPDALEKAERADEILRERVSELDISEIHTSFLGYNGCHPGIADRPADPNEIVLRVAVKAEDESTIQEFGRRTLPVLISGPPNVTPVVEGRPKPSDVLSYWPCTIPSDRIDPAITVRSTGEMG